MRGTRTRSLILFLSCLAQFVCLSQTQPARDDILRDVRQSAHRHAESGSGKDSKYALDLWEKNSSGVTRQEILRTYDEEFTNAKKEHDSNDWSPKAGWIVAGLLFIGLIFLDRVKQALGKALDFAGETLFNFLAGMPWFYRLALNRYRAQMIDRHSKLKIPFRPDKPLDLTSVFVPLKVTDAPESPETIDAYEALAKHARLVVKGLPGSGKSILLRHVALRYARRRSALFRSVPVLVELNRLNDPSVSLQSELRRELSTKGFPKPDAFLMRALKNGTLLLLLDGLDEISASRRPAVVQQIRDLADEFPAVRLIVSCRTQVYNGDLDAVIDKTLEIQSFTDQQIRSFLHSWAPDMLMHGKSIDQLLRTLVERPAIMLLARNPLMLTIIAWLYTDTTVVLPHSRSEFYRKTTELLLYDWKPEANTFKLVPKQLVLRNLALYFQDNSEKQKDRRSVDVQTILQRIGAILPSLNIDSKESAMSLLTEIVQRSGLLLAIDGGERYQFAHLTLQEYFAAAALRSDPNGLIERFKKDHDAWREPVKLWCGLDEDATELVKAIHQIDPVTGFECLADAQKIESEVANQIVDSMKELILSDNADPTLASAFGLVASSLSDRGKAVFKWLSAQDAPPALDALSYTNMPQAAKALASLYINTPAVGSLLCRLGELAVPELHQLAEVGHASAIDDLLAIGTPGAAEALVALLWHNSPKIATRSAFAIAALFPSPEIFAVLRGTKIDQAPEADWVWGPFETNEPTDLGAIAGRVALLLPSAHELTDLPLAKLDPRLVLPVCAQTGSELIPIYAPNDARLLSISELYQKLAGKRDDSNFQETVGKMSDEVLEGMTLALLDRLKPPARWRFLFSRLHLPIQAELVRGISSSRLPNQEDWVNIFRPVSYTARRDWHLWLLAGLIFAVAIGDMMFLLGFRRPIDTSAILLSIVLLLGGAFQLFLLFDDDDDMLYVIEAITFAIFKLHPNKLNTNIEVFSNKILDICVKTLLILIIYAWTPAWITASFLLITRRFEFLPAAAFIGLFVTSMMLLWLRARRLERLSRNPLSGLRRFLITESELKL